jgi:[ribosomal protein S5]-alanine N-acetyltransferase
MVDLGLIIGTIEGGYFMVAIKTTRLLLRNFKEDDAESLWELIVQKEASEYAVYDYAWPTSPDEIKGVTDWFASEDRYIAVCLKENGKLIGFIGLNPAEGAQSKVFDLGYCFNSDYHGQGYATEGCKAVIEFAFSELNAESLSSGTAAVNLPSCRLLGRLGFKKIGEGTASFRNTPDGKPIEFIGWEFALSREDWIKSRAALFTYKKV